MNAISKQQGFSFTGFIVGACLLIGFAIMAMKIVPAYMENKKIQKAFETIARDPAMQNATENEIRMSFHNRAVTMDGVTAVDSNKIDVYKDNGRVVLSADYSVKVPLASNASLLFEFHPSSAK